MRPPFSKKLVAFNPNAPSAELWIYFGDGDTWKRAKSRNSCSLPVLMLPPDKQADEFEWPVRDWEILLLQIGTWPRGDAQKFAYILLVAGAKIVRIITDDANLIVYRRNRDAA